MTQAFDWNEVEFRLGDIRDPKDFDQLVNGLKKCKEKVDDIWTVPDILNGIYTQNLTFVLGGESDVTVFFTKPEDFTGKNILWVYISYAEGR